MLVFREREIIASLEFTLALVNSSADRQTKEDLARAYQQARFPYIVTQDQTEKKMKEVIENVFNQGPLEIDNSKLDRSQDIVAKERLRRRAVRE